MKNDAEQDGSRFVDLDLSSHMIEEKVIIGAIRDALKYKRTQFLRVTALSFALEHRSVFVEYKVEKLFNVIDDGKYHQILLIQKNRP